MKEWMRANFLRDVPIPLFISGDLFGQARQQMAEDLDIAKRK